MIDMPDNNAPTFGPEVPKSPEPIAPVKKSRIVWVDKSWPLPSFYINIGDQEILFDLKGSMYLILWIAVVMFAYTIGRHDMWEFVKTCPQYTMGGIQAMSVANVNTSTLLGMHNVAVPINLTVLP